MVSGSAILGIDAAWTPRQPSGVALVTRPDGGAWRCLCVAPSYDTFVEASAGRSVPWRAVRILGTEPDVDQLLAAAGRLLGGQRIDLVTIDMPVSRTTITGRRPADNVVSKAFGAAGCGTHTPNTRRPGPPSQEHGDSIARSPRLKQPAGLHYTPFGKSTARHTGLPCSGPTEKSQSGGVTVELGLARSAAAETTPTRRPSRPRVIPRVPSSQLGKRTPHVAPRERPQAASVIHPGGIAAPCPLRGRLRRPGRRCRHATASGPKPTRHGPLQAVGRSARTRQVGTTPSCLWAAERLDNRLAHLRQHARIRPGGRNRTLPGGKRRNDPRGLLTRPWTAPALVLDTRENRSA